MIDRVLIALANHDCVVPGILVSDTLKQVDGQYVDRTINEQYIRRIQTPRGFKTTLLKQAVKIKHNQKLLMKLI